MKKEEGDINVKSVLTEEDLKANGVIGEAKHVPTKEEVKRRAKQAAIELADYKRRLRESVELKRLQVEEIELNIRYHEAREQYKTIMDIVAKEEEEEARLEAEQAEKNKAAQNIEIAHHGQRRTEEEIEQAKKELS